MTESIPSTAPIAPSATAADAAAKKHILLIFAGLMVTMLIGRKGLFTFRSSSSARSSVGSPTT